MSDNWDNPDPDYVSKDHSRDDRGRFVAPARSEPCCPHPEMDHGISGCMVKSQFTDRFCACVRMPARSEPRRAEVVRVDDGQYKFYECGCTSWSCPTHHAVATITRRKAE